MGQKVVIEDLQSLKQSNGMEDYQINAIKAYIKEQHRLSAVKPRDPSVWNKSEFDKKQLKLAKIAHKKLMISEYPEYTNKYDFYTQKAMIWS